MVLRVYASNAGAVPYVTLCHGEEQELCTSVDVYEEDRSSVCTAWVCRAVMMCASLCAPLCIASRRLSGLGSVNPENGSEFCSSSTLEEADHRKRLLKTE
jgi:hypothetical protein